MIRLTTGVMFLVFLASLGGGLYIYDYIGVFDIAGRIRPWIAKIPIIGYTMAEQKLTPDEFRVRELERLQESISDKERRLANQELELSEREKDIQKGALDLDRRDREIRDAEMKWADQQRRSQELEARLSRLAAIFMSMPPEAASNQLGELDDDLVIQVLNRMKVETVSLLLAQMTPQRATTIESKMGRGSVIE